MQIDNNIPVSSGCWRDWYQLKSILTLTKYIHCKMRCHVATRFSNTRFPLYRKDFTNFMICMTSLLRKKNYIVTKFKYFRKKKH